MKKRKAAFNIKDLSDTLDKLVEMTNEHSTLLKSIEEALTKRAGENEEVLTRLEAFRLYRTLHPFFSGFDLVV
jgi:hypothetical protein